jgi:hypothetical protein
MNSMASIGVKLSFRSGERIGAMRENGVMTE